MAKNRIKIKDPDLAKVGVALKRAATKARQLGFDTNTPVYVYRDGKIIDIVKEHRTRRSPEKAKITPSTRKTNSTRVRSPKKKT